MNKLLIGTLALALVATPAAAQYRYDPYQPRYEHRHSRGKVTTGEAVAIGIGALVLGAALADSNRQRQYNPAPAYGYTTPEQDAYERGRLDRQREEQARREQRAYECGYYGRC